MVSKFLAILKRPEMVLKYFRREKNLQLLLNIGMRDVKTYLLEAERLSKAMLKITTEVESELGTMCSKLRGPIVYTCVRAIKPSIAVETGVASGSSSYYILQAMELNRKGNLYSIDLPNMNPGALIPSEKSVGWMIPRELKHRWHLTLGRSQEKLTELLQKLKTIDMFLHDSEHTYETMMFEYETAWLHLREGSVLLSDDIHWNRAFYEFVKNKNPKRWIAFDGLGAAIK